MEESDIEFEQLQEQLEGGESQEDKESEALRGTWIPFCRKWTGRSAAAIKDGKLRKMLASTSDLYDIPIGERGRVYRYMEKELNKCMLEKLKENLKGYKAAVDTIRIAKVRCDAVSMAVSEF